MNNILDRIAASNPFLYKKIEYTVIEISSKLAFLQQESLRLKEVSVNHANIKVVNKSILDWSETEERNCFILAMEVIDNLAHDMIRYDFESKVPYQAIVSVDASGNYQESYELVTSPVIKEYLEFQSNFRPINPLLNENAMLNRRLKSFLWPFQANLSEAIYLPTNTLKLFQVLKNKFPRHCLCLSDFSFLPESIEGTNAPVVQRRYE